MKSEGVEAIAGSWDGFFGNDAAHRQIGFFRSITHASNDGSGTTGGEWHVFDHIEISRDAQGDGTWVVLAFDVAVGGGGPTSRQRWRIRAWTGETGVEEVPGGLPLAGGIP